MKNDRVDVYIYIYAYHRRVDTLSFRWSSTIFCTRSM